VSGTEKTQNKIVETACRIVTAPVCKDDSTAYTQDTMHFCKGSGRVSKEVESARRNHDVTDPILEG
jgi:hypothetical protein